MRTNGEGEEKLKRNICNICVFENHRFARGASESLYTVKMESNVMKNYIQ
jgi:hypothetical protein